MSTASDTNDTLLMMSLCKFYRDPSRMDHVIPIIEGVSDVSLRLIDFFVTGYVRRHNTTIPTVLSNGMTSQLNVHISYRAQLQAYSKHAFDCFRRRERILFCYATDKSIETTVGQLNFFRWLITHGVLKYIIANRAEIERDMIQTQKASQTQPTTEGATLAESAEIKEHSNPPEALMKRFPGTTTLTFV